MKMQEVEDEKKVTLNKYMNASRHTCPLYIYELVLPIIIAFDLYRPTIKELQLLRRRVVYTYSITIYLKRALGEQFVYLEMMRDRHTHRLILVPSSKFVGYGSVDADDEAKGLEAPYINQSK